MKNLDFEKILDILSTYAITYLGKDLSKSLNPSNNYETANKLLLETNEALNLIKSFSNPPIHEICDISIFLKMLESNCHLSTKGLLEINNILKISHSLKDFFFNDNVDISNFPILNEYFSALYSNHLIEQKISESIIDEFTISDTASPALASIRTKLRNIEQNIKNKLSNFIHSSSYSKYIQDSIITIRNDRYVIPVKSEYRRNIKGFIHDTSSTGATIFIEPTIIFDLNSEYLNLKVEENLEIEKILENLSSLLTEHINELKINLKVIGQLDFIFAKAKYSIYLDCTLPILSKEKCIDLKQARHPLIDKSLVVPNDIYIGFDFTSLLITGPNTGGKTVTLKTVGLLCSMAMSGLNIPANENSKVFVFDNIFADIGDEQSIEASLSTFSSHMVNIVDIINKATENSLILLDELGSGTDPIEGSSLAISILEYFQKKGSLTISTTHYPELKNYALVTPGFKNASSEFCIEDLKPTFKLLIGVPGKSNAFAISLRIGLPEEILKRASDFLNNDTIHIEDLLKNIYDEKSKIEKEKDTILKNSNQIELLKKSLQRDKKHLENNTNEIIEKAKLQARDIILKAKNDANEIIRQMKIISSNQTQNATKELNDLRNKLNTSLQSSLTPYNNSSSSSKQNSNNLSKEEIKIGMKVYVTELNQIATILSNPDKSNNVQVQIGISKLKINISKLEKSNGISTNNTNSIKKHSNFTVKQISSEINVIGLNVEEANFLIDKYLDDAYRCNLKIVRIVHGKGTGALKNGIHIFLKKHPHVSSFRIGTFGEGEMGVTVVELK